MGAFLGVCISNVSLSFSHVDHTGDDSDILRFMWSESSSDIPRIAFGDSIATQKRKAASASTASPKGSLADSESQLKMKTKGRTATLQAICKKLDDQLETFLEDARHFAVVKGTIQ